MKMREFNIMTKKGELQRFVGEEAGYLIDRVLLHQQDVYLTIKKSPFETIADIRNGVIETLEINDYAHPKALCYIAVIVGSHLPAEFGHGTATFTTKFRAGGYYRYVYPLTELL